MATRTPEGREALEVVRRLVAALPGVEERVSHGAPAWFAAGRQIAAFADHHHNDGRLALWCMAPPGAQAMLVDSEPEHYFVPAYVGHLGWIGVRLDRGLPVGDVAGAIERAYEHALSRAKPKKTAAPKKATAVRPKAKRPARSKAPTKTRAKAAQRPA